MGSHAKVMIPLVVKACSAFYQERNDLINHHVEQYARRDVRPEKKFLGFVTQEAISYEDSLSVWKDVMAAMFNGASITDFDLSWNEFANLNPNTPSTERVKQIVCMCIMADSVTVNLSASDCGLLRPYSGIDVVKNLDTEFWLR